MGLEKKLNVHNYKNRVLDTFLGIWVTNAFFTYKCLFGNASTGTFLDVVDKLQLDIPRRR